MPCKQVARWPLGYTRRVESWGAGSAWASPTGESIMHLVMCLTYSSFLFTMPRQPCGITIHVFVEQLRGFCMESRGRAPCNAWSCQDALPMYRVVRSSCQMLRATLVLPTCRGVSP